MCCVWLKIIQHLTVYIQYTLCYTNKVIQVCNNTFLNNTDYFHIHIFIYKK